MLSEIIAVSASWLYYVLPIFGMCVILFCVVAYFSKIGDKIRDKVLEVFKWGNTEVKISVITIFIIVGVACIFYWVYSERDKAVSSLRDEVKAISDEKKQMDNKLTELNVEIKNLKAAQNLSMDYSIELEGVRPENEIEFKKLNLRGYYVKQHEEEKRYPIEKICLGLGGKIIVTLNEIQSKTMILEMNIQNESGKEWVVANFYPLKPSLTLSKKAS